MVIKIGLIYKNLGNKSRLKKCKSYFDYMGSLLNIPINIKFKYDCSHHTIKLNNRIVDYTTKSIVLLLIINEEQKNRMSPTIFLKWINLACTKETNFTLKTDASFL